MMVGQGHTCGSAANLLTKTWQKFIPLWLLHMAWPMGSLELLATDV